MNDLTSLELYNAVIEKLEKLEIHPLHKAIIEECCENAIESDSDKNLESLIPLVHLAVLSSDSVLKGVLKGSFEATDADEININYRNQVFTIKRNSTFLN